MSFKHRCWKNELFLESMCYFSNFIQCFTMGITLVWPIWKLQWHYVYQWQTGSAELCAHPLILLRSTHLLQIILAYFLWKSRELPQLSKLARHCLTVHRPPIKVYVTKRSFWCQLGFVESVCYKPFCIAYSAHSLKRRFVLRLHSIWLLCRLRVRG